MLPTAWRHGASSGRAGHLHLRYPAVGELKEHDLALLAPNAHRLMRVAPRHPSAVLQMSARQVAEWSDNPAQYVADEEESTFTVRVSGELLIDALLQVRGGAGGGPRVAHLRMVYKLVCGRLGHSSALRTGGRHMHPQMRESRSLEALAHGAYAGVGALRDKLPRPSFIPMGRACRRTRGDGTPSSYDST